MIRLSLSKRNRHIFIAAIIFIAVILLYNFIFEPGIKKWQGANIELSAKKTKINSDIRLINRRNDIIQEYNKYAKATKNISKVLSYAEDLANSLNIRTSGTKPGQEVEKDFYKEYSIELQIEGRFQDIIQFLSELAKLPALLTLEKCNLKVVSENPSIFKGTIILSKIII